VEEAVEEKERCNILHHTATHCNALQHTATHCNTLQHNANHCNTRPQTDFKGLGRNMEEVVEENEKNNDATHCNTLQHIATQCEPMQHTTTNRFSRAGKKMWRKWW